MFMLIHLADVIAETANQKAELKNVCFSSLHVYGIDRNCTCITFMIYVFSNQQRNEKEINNSC